MGLYPGSAMERAMKVQEVMVRAMSGQLRWFQAAEILGITPRHLLRIRQKYEEFGYGGLLDRRCQRPGRKRVPLATVERVLQLYRDQYFDFNVQHFHEVLEREYDIHQSYSWVKQLLQASGLVKLAPKRGPHRKRRERRPLPGMLLHIDASKHAWLPGADSGYQDLLTISDDATNELYYAAFVDEESTATVMAALDEVVRTHGVLCALYTDRARHFVWTPKAGEPFDPRRKTQVGRALQQLGIELIAAHSPQARGRKGRLYGTLQGRWPQELRVREITTPEAANAWLRQEALGAYNTRFAVPAAQPGTAFLPAPAQLERIFSIQHDRIVGNDNTVRFGRQVLQIGPTALRWSFAKCGVTVHEHLDDTLSVTYGPHTLARFTATGAPIEAIKVHTGDQRSSGAPGGARNDDRRPAQASVSPSSKGKSKRAAA